MDMKVDSFSVWHVFLCIRPKHSKCQLLKFLSSFSVVKQNSTLHGRHIHVHGHITLFCHMLMLQLHQHILLVKAGKISICCHLWMIFFNHRYISQWYHLWSFFRWSLPSLVYQYICEANIPNIVIYQIRLTYQFSHLSLV